ncbi:S8 family serine peptidase [Neolewinella aurantiaca]|uniref:S8 family serine peptidase n=1 Tax=Neolewinella aurantiaca TaxID=2602767 RepID=A0A5C7FTF7_9BACT|nr:S8 family serine peptidase [Neolewinella aurantiaca]TXF89520.1 S8 family serine peptidase [Neolewinella aurantiaca]
MKHHQFLLCLALLGVILLWSGCDDEDLTDPDCTVDIPVISTNVLCGNEPYYFENLDEPQAGNLPSLPFNCTTSGMERIVRIDEPADGDFYLQLYVGVAATVHFQVFGANCEDNVVPITGCLQSDAVAVSERIVSANDFEDVYVVIDYTLFTSANHLADYVLGPDEFIGVAAIDELPQTDAIDYRDQSSTYEGPGRLAFSCDGGTFQRVIIGSCNNKADVYAWAREMGLPISEAYQGEGGTTVALDIPEGMSPNAVGGMGDKPLTKPRRPKADSSDFFIEEDYIIEVSTLGNGLFDGNDISIPEEALPCLAYQPRNGSRPGGGNVIVNMIDSGIEIGGAFNDDFQGFIYQDEYESAFAQPGLFGFDYLRGDFEPNDEIGHGTATAGTVIGDYRGDAPLTVFHSKIFGINGLASYFGAVVATNEAVDMKSTIINMSWGIPLEEAPQALTCAVQRAASQGVVIVTTAGNENANIDAAPQWPGAFGLQNGFENVITVASMQYPNNNIDEDPVKASFSNFSNQRVNVAAYLTSQSPAFMATDLDDFDYIGGTSISAPLITRSLAAYLGPNGGGLALWTAERLERSSQLNSLGQVYEGLYLPVCSGF